MKHFTKTLLLIPIAVFGLLSTASAADKLEFNEQLTFVNIDDREPIGQQSVGDVLTLKSVLFNADTGTQEGTKDVTCETIEQRNNGDLIIFCKETTTLPNGTIDTEGEINATKFDRFLYPEKLDITGGTGAYKGARGKETITRIARDKYTSKFVLLP